MRKLEFPFAGHLGRLHLFVHQLNDFAASGGTYQVILLGLDEPALFQRLDDSRLCGRGSESAVLHRFGKFFVLYLLSGGFHRRKECRFGVVLGLALLFLLKFNAVERGLFAYVPCRKFLDDVRDFVVVALAAIFWTFCLLFSLSSRVLRLFRTFFLFFLDDRSESQVLVSLEFQPKNV